MQPNQFAILYQYKAKGLTSSPRFLGKATNQVELLRLTKIHQNPLKIILEQTFEDFVSAIENQTELIHSSTLLSLAQTEHLTAFVDYCVGKNGNYIFLDTLKEYYVQFTATTI